MARPRALILRAAGTNCDRETAHAFELAGAETGFLHVNRLLEQPKRLLDFQALAIPGGFTYGDDIAAGKILANQLVHHLRDALSEFVAAGRLVIGICNGFQALVKTGLLPGLNGLGSQQVTLSHNDSGRFECRWVRLASGGSRCVFFPDAARLMLPVAHAEGKFAPKAAADLKTLDAGGQIVFRYTAADGGPSPTYPDNPNGSVGHVAGICDPTGHVLGMMPHPERFVRRQQHPAWTRGGVPEQGDGLALFRNAVAYFG